MKNGNSILRLWMFICVYALPFVPLICSGAPYYWCVVTNVGECSFSSTNLGTITVQSGSGATPPASWTARSSNRTLHPGESLTTSALTGSNGDTYWFRVVRHTNNSEVIAGPQSVTVGSSGNYIVTIAASDSCGETCLTNSVSWVNQTQGELVVQPWVNGVAQSWSTVLAGASYTNEWRDCGLPPVMPYVVLQILLGGEYLVDEIVFIGTNNPAGSTSISPPPPNQTSNVLWSATEGAALDSTLREGFQLLYNQAAENQLRTEKLASGSNQPPVSVSNAVSVSNYVGLTVTNLPGDQGWTNTLLGMSNMMARSGNDETSTNALPWLGNRDGTLSHVASAVDPDQITDFKAAFGNFTKIGTVSKPDMLITCNNKYFTISWDMDPMNTSWSASIFTAIKTGLTWALTLAFSFWCGRHVFTRYQNLMQTSQLAVPNITSNVSAAGFGMGANAGWLFSAAYVGVIIVSAAGLIALFTTFKTSHDVFLANLLVAPISQGSLAHMGVYLFTSAIPWDYALTLLELGLLWWLVVEFTGFAATISYKLLVR